ncbi:unnamed protein product [Arabis nemorensis]|uniref:Uncharacterized protein n=1 Tax=Arabis nemorensis TaxID=586526 RepID=A0A565BJW9_9BRAS|nr:unnamed protein product [Arabis nemorensis]
MLIPLLKKLKPQIAGILEQIIQRCQERITTCWNSILSSSFSSCYTLELAPLRLYTFPPIKPRKSRQKKARKEMVKATFKRVNYTDVAKEIPAPSKRTDATVKQAGPSVAAQGASNQVSLQTEKAAEASLAAKKVGKRVANLSTEVAKKVSDKETRKKRPNEVAIEGSKKKQRVEESTEKTASVEAAASGSEEEPATYDLSFTFKLKDYIASIPQACAELCSRIPCSTEHDFPAYPLLPLYQLVSELRLFDFSMEERFWLSCLIRAEDVRNSICEESGRYQICPEGVQKSVRAIFGFHQIFENYMKNQIYDHIWESDHRKIRASVSGASKEARGLSERGKEAKKVSSLEKKVATQIAAMDDLSKKAEEARERAKYAKAEL